MSEPKKKRAVSFIDGQNLFHAAKEAFGYVYPNYDLLALTKKICEQKSWDLETVYFYTGVPAIVDTVAPYAVNWNTSKYTVGTHTITATAKDYAGNQKSTTVTVTVRR